MLCTDAVTDKPYADHTVFADTDDIQSCGELHQCTWNLNDGK